MNLPSERGAQLDGVKQRIRAPGEVTEAGDATLDRAEVVAVGFRVLVVHLVVAAIGAGLVVRTPCTSMASKTLGPSAITLPA